MISRKKFVFISNKESARIKKLEVEIPEVVDPQYGMFTWPCAPVLAQYLFYHQDQINGKKVLEIGAGTALAGVVAAKLGAKVILSDADKYSNCLENCRKSCLANNVSDAEITPLTWGRVSKYLVNLKDVDFIVGSDCFYDKEGERKIARQDVFNLFHITRLKQVVFKDFEAIIFTIAYIMEKNPTAVFLTTYQIRNPNHSIIDLLIEWKLQSRKIALSSFDADGELVGGHSMSSKHEIQLYEIKKAV